WGARGWPARVVFVAHVVRRQRRVEARPAGARIELGDGVEKRRAAARAAIRSRIVLVPVFAAERALGPLLAGDLVLLGRKFLLPFSVGFCDLGYHEVLLRDLASVRRRRIVVE